MAKITVRQKASPIRRAKDQQALETLGAELAKAEKDAQALDVELNYDKEVQDQEEELARLRTKLAEAEAKATKTKAELRRARERERVALTKERAQDTVLRKLYPIAELGEEAAEFLADVTPTKSPLNCSLPN